MKDSTEANRYIVRRYLDLVKVDTGNELGQAELKDAESEFIKAAKVYGEGHCISYETFSQFGVPTNVLEQAGMVSRAKAEERFIQLAKVCAEADGTSYDDFLSKGISRELLESAGIERPTPLMFSNETS